MCVARPTAKKIGTMRFPGPCSHHESIDHEAPTTCPLSISNALLALRIRLSLQNPAIWARLASTM